MAEKKPIKPEKDGDVRTLAEAISGYDTTDLYHNSYLSRSTIKRLREGKTRAPQHMTMTGIAAAAGFEYVLRRTRPVAKRGRK